MVLMAVDHAANLIARVHPLESWGAPPPYYADTTAFLTRWLTHLSAPGFFMLMGIGIVWFAESRRAAGWSTAKIARYFLTRGAVLLLVQQFIENPAFLLGFLSADPAVAAAAASLPGAPGDVKLLFQVLSALGVGMMVWGVCWRLRIWAIATVCVAISIRRSSRSFGRAGWLLYMAKVPRTLRFASKMGVDQQARNPWGRARSR